MWNKCPICNGTGRYTNPLSNETLSTCPTCKGHRIISDLTGLPPNNPRPSRTFNSTDFRDNCEQFEDK